ncbi:DegT/DnrJ/EryC1/StrS family aminotransferase [Vibrio fluvialis]|uniref:DegT/DnrJ/EryC1/StrS family aminotransferase n=1 Tax=Vibrio fluvialis TaxID=676 RepID=UPI001559552C|nr:DegT/DnrJ/EryC1/StrS family aminotransferase [Vibrio fluvialis]EKO3369867.1 DegT/DnrJ/EryC1/StrS family aminotransferase [Vibrio fluvialis]EKO3387397.1 DegT/DnrJ/EryC1/StrS family aminotransferase [Vibrio fluvialis]EKO3418155.1 DegT/DnrJ/EryC1/StrS family aminotransferase [Vibrio fluvialis]EKO3492083.1 DegT/DnrJ/EryC1/StrS family aminotransferase [Vibrio fluvialis]EKO3550822.1 DegT/DnrJ/EryC1/StrS family aminotransferase [Vibrio fluvialis]
MKKIRLSKASISNREIQEVSRVMSNEYLGMGQETKVFEQDLAEYLGVPKDNVVAVNTGTSALHISLSALGILPGDEVLVPTTTYVATFQAISALGAIPIACDISPDTVFVDIHDLERKISPRTKAIMPVHYGSSCKGIEEIYAIARKYNLRVVEDAAQSFGSLYKGKKVGTFGDIICFSFDGIKNITCGEGGLVVSSDSMFTEKVRNARLLGVIKDTDMRYSNKRSWDFDVEDQGYRYHLSNINAAIGRVQLTRIQEFRIKRQSLVKIYLDNLRNVSPLYFDYDEIMPHIFVVRTKNRDGLRDYLLSNGVEVGTHYKPNHLLSKYKCGSHLPIAEKLERELISLPLHCDLSEQDVLYICRLVNEFLNEQS